MRSKLLAHSPLDALLVILALAQFAILVSGVLTAGIVPWGISIVLGLVSAFLLCTNFMCIGHNFVHNPFFTSKRLNRLFAMFNSLNIGVPQTLHQLQHMHHHKFNNDAFDHTKGTTQDYTSTYRYGRPPGEEEHLIKYALLGTFRVDTAYLWAEVKRRRLRGRLAGELASMVLMLTILGMFNPIGLVTFYVPVWVLGNVITQAENYLEHHGAIPGDRRTDSVSSYGLLYNLVWFNNGYHQEHHYRPQAHWSRLPEITPLLPPVTERRVAPYAHWFNFRHSRAFLGQ